MGNPLLGESIGNMFYFLVVPSAHPCNGTIILGGFDHDLRSVTGRELEGIHPMDLVNHVFIQPDNDDNVMGIECEYKALL
jgi:hypothetical protein